MKTYTKREIAFLFQTSERTILEDIKALNITAIDLSDHGLKLYSEEQFQLIKELREHCLEGKTRDTFLKETPVEIVLDKPKKIINKNEDARLEVSKSPQVVRSASFIDQAKLIDPLADLVILQRLSDNKWLLPTARLAEILGVSRKTLLNKKIYTHCGFICTRELKVKAYLWKIEANNS